MSKTSFLSRIAAELLSEFGADMSNVYVILPNRRAGRFLKMELAEMAESSILAPKTTSIEDFVREMSGLDIIDRNALLLHFFEIYKQTSHAKNSTLGQFLRWANTFLDDLDEMDLEMVDTKALFASMLSAERLESWDPENAGVTEFQQRHLNHVAKFPKYYEALQDFLQERGMAYRGMAYRILADLLESEGLPLSFKKIYIVGFNALYHSEELIFEALTQTGKAVVCWDADQGYLDDKMHEAGVFLRKYSKNRHLGSPLNWVENNLNALSRKVDVVPIPGSMGQTQAAASILTGLLKTEAIDPLKTAIVVNDSKLLQPLLRMLPGGDDVAYNITMGFPFRMSGLAQFVDHWLAAHILANASGGRFHYRTLGRLVRQAPTRFLLKGSINGVMKVASSNVHIIPKEIIAKADDNEMAHLMFAPLETAKEAVNRLLKLNDRFAEADENTMDSISNFVGTLDRILHELHRFLDLEESITDLHDLQLIWNQLNRQSQVSFEGEPLHGIQIMGMLETRLLDFDRIIMLGTNEGSLPGSSDKPTFIPFDIGREAGMRSRFDQDAVFAYHFQRLLQRCPHVSLIYDSDPDSSFKGEASRYISQLQMEPWKNTTVTTLRLQSPQVDMVNDESINIEKGDFELAAVAKYFERGVSPSGLNTYLRCPLQFYYRYVLKLGESVEMSESMDHAQFGTVVHDSLEKLYEEFKGKHLSVTALNEKRKLVDEMVATQYQHTMEHVSAVVGRDLLSVHAAKRYVLRVIDQDLAYIKEFGEESLVFEHAELELKVNLNLGLKPPFSGVKIGGKVDRIDRLATGEIRVLDFKTGKVEQSHLRLKSAINLVEGKDGVKSKNMEKAVQLSMYALMLEKIYPISEKVQLGISSLRSDDGPLLLEIDSVANYNLGEIISEVKPVLSGVIKEIADASVPFCQTEDSKICDFCAYAAICGK